MAGNIRRIELPVDKPLPIVSTVWGSELNLFEDMASAGYPVGGFVVHRLNQEGGPTELGIQIGKGNPFVIKRGLNHPLNPGEILCYARALVPGIFLMVDEAGV